jgi:hypothetical protein
VGRRQAGNFFLPDFSDLKLVCKTYAQQVLGKVFRRLSRSK